MSRSTKRNVVYKDYRRNYTWYAKRQANKAVRRYKGDIPNGKSYRKIYCSYNIFDWNIYYTKYEVGIPCNDGSYSIISKELYDKLKRK